MFGPRQVCATASCLEIDGGYVQKKKHLQIAGMKRRVLPWAESELRGDGETWQLPTRAGRSIVPLVLCRVVVKSLKGTVFPSSLHCPDILERAICDIVLQPPSVFISICSSWALFSHLRPLLRQHVPQGFQSHKSSPGCRLDQMILEDRVL